MLPTYLADPNEPDAVSPEAGQLLAELEARQDEVLKELDALEAVSRPFWTTGEPTSKPSDLAERVPLSHRRKISGRQRTGVSKKTCKSSGHLTVALTEGYPGFHRWTHRDPHTLP